MMADTSAPAQKSGGGEAIPAPVTEPAQASPQDLQKADTSAPAQKLGGGEAIPAPVTEPAQASPQDLQKADTSAPAQKSNGGEAIPAPVTEPAQASLQDLQKADTSAPAQKSGVADAILAPVTEPAQASPQDLQKVDVNSANEVIRPDITEAALKNKEVEESIKPAVFEEVNAGKELQNNNIAPESVKVDWEKREQQLLKRIEELEKSKSEGNEDTLRLGLKIREEEIDLLKARVKNLETELQAAFSKPGAKNHEMIEHIKQQHEELLTKARGMIFDKTKMVKNQELQIEALTTQVQSLKDINLITKDLLEIRNSEVKAMEERLEAMDARFKAEKERHSLVLQRAQTSTNINDDLRREYETQLSIFKELREKYEQRVKALVAENERLKASLQGGSSA